MKLYPQAYEGRNPQASLQAASAQTPQRNAVGFWCEAATLQLDPRCSREHLIYKRLCSIVASAGLDNDGIVSIPRVLEAAPCGIVHDIIHDITCRVKPQSLILLTLMLLLVACVQAS